MPVHIVVYASKSNFKYITCLSRTRPSCLTDYFLVTYWSRKYAGHFLANLCAVRIGSLKLLLRRWILNGPNGLPEHKIQVDLFSALSATVDVKIRVTLMICLSLYVRQDIRCFGVRRLIMRQQSRLCDNNCGQRLVSICFSWVEDKPQGYTGVSLLQFSHQL